MLKLIPILLITMILVAGPATAANSDKNFGGVGIDGIPWANGQIVVRQLVTDGPAHQAGIKIGDIITHIDGKPTEGSNFQEMVQRRLRGIAGTKVTLKIHRRETGKNLTFTLTRRQLVIGKTAQK